jgi:hypothetical protein
MFFYPHEQYPYTYLLLISAIILLAFACLKLADRRAVWLLSISAPGILILPDYIVGAYALHQRDALPVSIILGGAILHFFFVRPFGCFRLFSLFRSENSRGATIWR